MNEYLSSLHEDLANNTQKDYSVKDYDKYFEVTQTPKCGIRIKAKKEAILETAKKIMGILHSCRMRFKIRLKRYRCIAAKISLKRSLAT